MLVFFLKSVLQADERADRKNIHSLISFLVEEKNYNSLFLYVTGLKLDKLAMTGFDSTSDKPDNNGIEKCCVQ